MDKLIEFFKKIHPLPPGFETELRKAIQPEQVRKRKILLKPGQPCERMYFIEKGLLRGSKIRNGKETCLWFMKENDLMTSVTSYYKGIESTEYIFTMEDSYLFSITKEQLEYLKEKWVQFNITVLYLTEKYYVLGMEREHMLRVGSASDKYRYFLKTYPELEDRVPDKYIASFLGMRLETLSREKSKL